MEELRVWVVIYKGALTTKMVHARVPAKLSKEEQALEAVAYVVDNMVTNQTHHDDTALAAPLDACFKFKIHAPAGSPNLKSVSVFG